MNRGVAAPVARVALAAALALVVAGGPVSAGTTAVVGGTIHPVSGPVVEDGVLLFDETGILAVGTGSEVDVPAQAERIDARGRHVWPGMINAQTNIGLVEIGSVRGTQDSNEHGTMNPNARAEIALNASSSHIPVTRANGVLLAATLPGGGLVSGTGAAIALTGWTAEELVRRAPIGLVVSWPSMPSSAGEDSAAARWEGEIARLDEMIEEARAYSAARKAGAERDADVRWESLHGVVNGTVPVWIRARTLRQIRAAVDWTDRHRLRMVLIAGSSWGGASDAPLCADELAARDIPVVLKTTRHPALRSAPYDDAYTEPAKLVEAGVRVAFGTFNSSNARNLPQEAARAAAYGLPRASAERALTLGAAEILRIENRYGSLEPGKSATFLLVDGDLLETRMNVDRAWIDGAEVSLESRHTELWKEWSARPMPAGAPNE